MDKILLIFCNGISCFIISAMLFQFMNSRYKRITSKKWIYILAQTGMVVGTLCVNLINVAILNLIAWVLLIAGFAYFLYYEDKDRPMRRVLECEALTLCMCVCESWGAILLRWILQVAEIKIMDETMLYCLQATFSKIVLIFLYYLLINRFMGKGTVPYSKTRYIIYGIMLVYSLVNVLVIVEMFNQGQKSYVCVVNMGCIVLADLYLLYFVKMADEKDEYEKEVMTLKQQAEMQYEYYMAQTKKYDQTTRILHDVNKHIKAIEGLYGADQDHMAGEYAKEIGDMLKPLIPVQYTENPMLNILLTNKEAIMKEKGISLEIKIDNVNLDFIAPMDVTTIFGNLLDNAIEATEKVTEDKYIYMKISSYHKMVSVSIENSCGNVKWKNGIPVSTKGKNRGIGLLNVRRSIEKYDGNLTLKQEKNKFMADLFLNA